MSLSLEPVPLAQSVKEVVELIESLAAEKSVRLGLDLNDFGCEHILCDRQRFQQVLLNLLSNAVKYNRPTGEVNVALEKKETEARIRVRDTGLGIPEERMEDLFKPFRRLGMEESAVEGTGLGLTLCKRLTELMGGELGVQSIQGQGSTFSIRFPRAPRPAAAGEEHDPEPLDHGEPQGEHSVLYIEDNLSNLNLVEQILQRRPNIKLITAMQGTIGLDLARQHHPDVILLDLHLPDMQGDEALKRLRGHPETHDIEVIVVSADATAGQKKRLLEAGASDYLTKPLDVRRFIDVLDRSLT
jgi:CheY-like chemotaxis protein/anti-sigma regulatory factor (Ser/Thr protein kinase)